MKFQTLLGLALIMGFSTQALATHSPTPTTKTVTTTGTTEKSGESVTVSTWGYLPEWGLTCEHSMATSWFELAPGESIEFSLDLSGCFPEDREGFLFFGNVSKRKSSPQLDAANKILLDCVDDTGAETSAIDGSVHMQLDEATEELTVRAMNTNRKKALRIRLRSESGF